MKIQRPSVEMLNKLNRVIQLCTTHKQLDGAVNYCMLYCNTLPYGNFFNVEQYFESQSVQKMLLDALDAKRGELNNE